MLEAVLRHINNWFERTALTGEFVASGGSLKGVDWAGDYYRIIGSVNNDGLHRFTERDLTDEEFTGTVWLLAIPQAFLDLVSEIEEWSEANKPSAYSSESFGGYSYSRATDSAGNPTTWQGAFASRLNAWRKL